MNILFLAHRIPYPPDKGDKIRSYNLIRHLAKKNDLFLGTILEEQNDENHLLELGKYCKKVYAAQYTGKSKLLYSIFSGQSFSVSNFYDKDLQKFVDETLENHNIQVLICFCSSMAEYVFKTPLFKKNKLKGIKLIMDYVDLDSDKWRQYSEFSKGFLKYLYNMERKRLFKFEIIINQIFHHSIFISQREVATFKKHYPDVKNIKIIPNGVDYEYFSPDVNSLPHPTKKYIKGPMLLFTGVMDYFANINGVTWFCHEIFPIIKNEIPDAQFYIVGNKPTDAVWALSEIEGVNVTGYVEDIRIYYRMADVCVTPLRIARGLQNKVLEAMSTGNAVVATSSAKNGIVCTENKDIIVADDEKKFAAEVISLIKNKEKRAKMSLCAMKNVHKNYSWDENLKILDSILT